VVSKRRPTDPRLGSVAWKQLRVVVLNRARGMCEIRGPRCSGAATTVDHIVPRSEHGDMWSLDNLRAACARCNAWHREQARRGRRTTSTEYVSRFD
jgi:5-methylcytosine-specific restriction endonuclease McrA